MKSWIAPLAAIALIGLATLQAADSKTRAIRGRVPLAAAAVAGEWNPPAFRHGKAFVRESRAARPRLSLPLPAGDALLLRLFYLLEGTADAGVRAGGRRAGRLRPGSSWQRAILAVPSVPRGRALSVSFELPPGRRLFLRRVDYRNYRFRLGGFLLLEPDGGSRASPGFPLALLIAAGLLAVCGAASVHRRAAEKPDRVFWRTLRPPAGIALAFLLVDWSSPYSLHAAPGFLVGLFLGAALLSAAGASAPKAGRRLILARAGLAAPGLAVSLGMAELAVRIWDPPISRPRIGSYAAYSPEYGWVNRAGAEGWQVDVGYHIRINRHGHRGPDRPLKKPPGVFRILGLGDSMTFGWGVEERETFLRRLERRLRAKGYQVEVLNAAVPAWHSSQSLRYLLRDGVRFEPDLVVMNFFAGDGNYYTVQNMRDSKLAKRVRAEEKERKGLTRNRPWRRFRLYNLWFNYRKILRAQREYRKRNPWPDFEAERKILPRDWDKNRERVEGLKRMMTEWARARDSLGIPVIITMIPAGGSLNMPVHQGEARALRRISRALGFRFLDLTPILERHPAPRTLYLHPRDGHMSAAGHAVVGAALAKMILEGKWLDKARRRR